MDNIIIYIMLILLVLILIIFLFIFIKNNNKEEEVKNLLNLLISKQNEEQKNFINNLEQKFINDNEKILNSFGKLKEEVGKISQANKNIENLNKTVNDFNSVLIDKKIRGNFGEMQLDYILNYAFGDTKLYSLQQKLSNNKIVDAIIYAPEPLNNIAIDSKFPINNFQNMQNAQNEEEEKKYEKYFIEDIRKHIKDISEKYTNQEGLNNYAFMFLPSDRVYYEAIKHDKIINESYSKNIWITSPTTLLSILNILNLSLKNIKLNKNVDIIQKRILDFEKEYLTYNQRQEKLETNLKQTISKIEDLQVTRKKLNKIFERIKEDE